LHISPVGIATNLEDESGRKFRSDVLTSIDLRESITSVTTTIVYCVVNAHLGLSRAGKCCIDTHSSKASEKFISKQTGDSLDAQLVEVVASSRTDLSIL
ncbi:hypothetical protein PMAYCL1PPCAC_06324, partial [Pristionchus mayeri]